MRQDVYSVVSTRGKISIYICGVHIHTAQAAVEGIEAVQLKFLQQSNEDQMQNLYRLWFKAPRVIHRYLVSRQAAPHRTAPTCTFREIV